VYTSMRSGQRDIYVSSYPEGDRHFRVTSGGGIWPKWRGDRIYYVDIVTEDLMSVSVQTNRTFRSGEPELVMTGDFLTGATYTWDVSVDGQEVAVVRERQTGVPPRVIAVENWLETVEF